jgi:signal transduction histidine kinase
MISGGLGQLTAFLAGVAVAVASFILKEIISDSCAGLRFRKQMATDLKCISTNYAAHLPALDRQIGSLSEDIRRFEGGEETDVRVSMIWDTEVDLLGILYRNSHHLGSEDLREAIAIYTILGRIDEIRTRYNDAASANASAAACTVRELRLPLLYLKDMRRQYLEVIQRAVRLLLRLHKNHWFIRADRADYEQLLARLESAR